MSKYKSIMKNELEELSELFSKSTEMKIKNVFYELLVEIQAKSLECYNDRFGKVIIPEKKEEYIKLSAQENILIELEKRLFD